MERKIAQILESEGKSKAKVKILSEALKSGAIAPKAVELAISEVEGPTRATLVEALEGATRKRQDLVDAHLFARIVECLWDAAPRVRWEAAKTLANVATEHRRLLDHAVPPLLANTGHEGTVVRWATARAIVAFLRAGCESSALRAKAQELAQGEADVGVRKIYQSLAKQRR